MKWYRQLHWQILTGLIAGLIYGIVASKAGWSEFSKDWIAPFGTVFISLLKLIAIPLVLTSLICGVASLSDTQKLTRMGGKTIALYMATTAVAIIIGLLLVNIVKPGKWVPENMRAELEASYSSDASSKMEDAAAARERGPLQSFVDMVPENFFYSASNNRNMLQLVFVSIILGIALIKIDKKRSAPVVDLFEGLNDMVIQVVNMIMLMAPIGVFALMSDTIVTISSNNPGQVLALLQALSVYMITVVAGLLIQAVVVYPAILRFFTKIPFKQFFVAISPAQLLAFSTSSSGATLPVTMDCCKKRLGIEEETTSFVLPLGATINMDGTALYQAIAAIFIAQAMNIDLGFGAQITILLTALLASIGTAAVPSAGIIMLVIILESINVPASGIALIIGVDRILDMARTTCNVTGDCAVASIIATKENQINLPG